MRKNSLIYPYFCYLKDYLENNRLLADVNGNTLRIHHYYPYGVEIGSVRVIADASGAVLQRHHFYPYGADLVALFASEGNSALPPGTEAGDEEEITVGDGTVIPYRFSGKERLDRAGLPLYDFGARWYNPVTISDWPDTKTGSHSV